MKLRNASLPCLAFSIPFFVTIGGCTIVSTTGDAGPPGAGGTGATGGSGGATASGGSANTGGSTSQTGGGGSGGSPTTDGATTGGGGSVSVNPDGGIPDTTAIDDPCTGPETTPNDDRMHATIYPLNGHLKACMQSDTDIDFFEFTTPSSPAAGGFIQVQLTDVGPFASILQIYSAHDNGVVQDTSTYGSGTSVFAWFAAQPGATYRAQVTSRGGITSPAPYLFTALFAGIPDVYEPNEDSTSAKQITPNTEVTGYYFSGFLDSTAPAGTTWADFYRITLAAAPVMIAVQPPADMPANFVLYDANAAQINEEGSYTPGSTVVLNRVLTTPGTYFINVRPQGIPATRGEGSTVPNYFTKPYKLTVTQ